MHTAKFVAFPYPDLEVVLERFANTAPSDELANHRNLIAESLRRDLAKTRLMIDEGLEGFPPDIRDAYKRLFELQLTTAENIIGRLMQAAEKASRVRSQA